MPNNGGNPVTTYTGTGLVPKRLTGVEIRSVINLPANISYPLGQVMGQIVSGNSGGTADQQTITVSGTPTGGNFTLTYSNGVSSVTITVPYNQTLTGFLAQLVAMSNVGVGNVFVTGGPFPGTAIVVNFVGALAGPQAVMTVNNAGLAGGSTPAAAVAHTTPGTFGTVGTAQNDTQVLTITGTPTGGGFYFQFAGVTSGLVNYNAAAATGSGAANVQAVLAAMSNIGAGNVVVTGGPLPGTAITIAFQGLMAGIEEPLLTTISALTGGTAPAIAIYKQYAGNSPTGHWAAYTQQGTDGRQLATGQSRALLEYPCATDSYGNITQGTIVGSGDNNFTQLVTNAWVTGIFDASQLTGLDQYSALTLGTFIQGNINTIATADTLIKL